MIFKKIFIFSKEIKINNLFDEKENLKAINQKYKNQFEELKEKIKSLQDLNMKLSEQIKILEEKNNYAKYAQSAMKNQITEREKIILSLQEERRGLEKFLQEKEKTEKLISDLRSSVSSLKDDLDRKNRKLRDKEKVNLEMKLPGNISINEISDKSSARKTVSEDSLDKLRNKVIRTLEIENKKLREKVKKLNYDNLKIMENNIENDIDNKNVPTHPGNHLIKIFFMINLIFNNYYK